MVECTIKDWQGNEAGNASLELKTAKPENASHIVHRALVRQMHNARPCQPRRGPKFAGVVASLGVKKVRVVLGLVLAGLPCGKVGV